MIASLGSAAWIARQACRGAMRSGSRLRASARSSVVPGSSSSWSIAESCCSQARPRRVDERLALLAPGIARRRRQLRARICSATSLRVAADADGRPAWSGRSGRR